MKRRITAILILMSMMFALLPAEAMAIVADNGHTAVNTMQEKKILKIPSRIFRRVAGIMMRCNMHA